MLVTTVYATEPADEKRLDEVVERGIDIMLFDLEKTTHVFSKTADGGIQQVIAKDKTDTAQIQLIQEHLLEISQEFSQGDFSKPEHIHGESMPGLAVLRTAGSDQLNIECSVLPDGAQITLIPQGFLNSSAQSTTGLMHSSVTMHGMLFLGTHTRPFSPLIMHNS